ncbi:hypothetical protein GF407_04165 [candidate division KSB1 bacterium]|nr:hypothetical protein [candidate division KSB1 bacterium]
MLPKVVVLDENICDKLANRLFDLGCHVRTCSSMSSALFKLQHESLRAVFFCCDHKDIDSVELLLNIRDIDRHIPLVLVDCPIKKREHQWVLNQPATFSINTSRLSTDRLRKILFQVAKG